MSLALQAGCLTQPKKLCKMAYSSSMMGGVAGSSGLQVQLVQAQEQQEVSLRKRRHQSGSA